MNPTTTFRRTALALGLGALGTAASAEPFTLFVFEAPEAIALRGDDGPAGVAYWESYAAFAQAATEAGVLKGGAPLVTEPAASATLTAAGERAAPFAWAELALSGYFEIDVPDRAAALTWAGRLPAATSGAVEVRPGFPAPAM